MRTQAYFDDIQIQILHELKKAKWTIHIAVAWFTDPIIFELLCEKAKSGVRVKLVIVNDVINRSSGINYSHLCKLGSSFMMVGEDKKNSAIMHNKFCVIDKITVITGSYNWSKKAQQNSENITIIYQHQKLAQQFVEEFESICRRFSGKDEQKNLSTTLTARLEALRLVIELNDEDDITLQVKKIKKLLQENKINTEINNILSFVVKKRYDEANTAINSFISQRKQVAIYVDPELACLKLELKSLEIQVSTLEDEKNEIEKLINSFNYRHAVEVGNIIRRILILKCAKLKGFSNKNEEKTYQKAQRDFEEFNKQFQETTELDRLKVTEAEQQELKAIFRACSKLCHPDIVAPEFKNEASQLFSKLCEANEKNDISKVRLIYNQLQRGCFVKISDTVNDVQKLHWQVIRMRTKLKELASSIFEMRNNETYWSIASIDDWDIYFKKLKQQLQEKLELLEISSIG